MESIEQKKNKVINIYWEFTKNRNKNIPPQFSNYLDLLPLNKGAPMTVEMNFFMHF